MSFISRPGEDGRPSEDAAQSFSMNYHTLATNEDGELKNSNLSIAQNKTKGSQVEKPIPKPRNPLRRSLSAQHRATKVRDTNINFAEHYYIILYKILGFTTQTSRK